MSTNEEQAIGVGERTPAAETGPVTTPGPPVADPAPLGLAAFAFTTFLLSAANAGWMTAATGAAWLGYAFGYGGLVQLLAGMWEFRNKNVFGSTAFGTYGGFWIGLAIWYELVAPKAHSPAAANHDIAWILVATAIFNTYMMFWSMQVNGAVFGVFLTLEATEIILIIGLFIGSTGIVKVGGYVGVLTALVAWYTSAAGVVNGMGSALRLPVGKPLITQTASPAISRA
ncbi:MAG TPA: acetate uptake transporter [Streptosporangiaceae bacterium]|nr:acetate uptake transporter [Streptosporangiaceae bacterium]